MLSVAKVGSAGGAAAYYTQEDNYYFIGEESTQWFGKGAEQLGLKGAVDKADFKSVLEGYLPNGDDLSHTIQGENKHRAGYDYTFSAPKSVSILALVKGDKSVLNAHKNAVEKVVTEIESLASTRQMVNGVPVITKTENIVGALFMHDTNRNLDPHLHTHAIIANVTFDETTGKFRTLSSDPVNKDGFVETTWSTQVALGKLYRQFLKEELAEQGFEFQTVGKNGLWEIKGIPQEVLKEFSSRREEIIASVSPDASNKSLSVATKDTRQAKDFTNKDVVKQFWAKKLEGLLPKFQVDELKLSPEKTKEMLKTQETQIAAIDQALPKVIAEISKNKAKFGRAEILNNIVDKVYFEGGNFSELVSSRVDKLVQEQGLIVTDRQQNYFTTPEHLAKESAATSLMMKLSHQVQNLKAETQTIIAQHITAQQSNFSLFSVRGRAEYDAKLVSDVQTLANENNKQHIILVATNTDKNNLREKIGLEPYVYTVKDYLKSEFATQSEQIVTLYRSEKMHLDDVTAVMGKSYAHQNTLVLLDTGGRNQKGIIRDLGVDMGLKDTVLKEAAERKSIVMMSDVDRGDQLNTAVKAYLNLAVNNKNIVMQISNAGNTNTNLPQQLTHQVRDELLKNGLLGQRTASIYSKEPVFIKRDVNGKADYSNAANYQKGYIIEQTNKGKTERWTIIDVNRKTGHLTVADSEGKTQKPWAMNTLNSTYNIYRNPQEIELRVGDKLRSMGHSNGIRADRELSVISISRPNMFFKQKITLEDNQGRSYVINANEDTKLGYGYVESVGRSQNGKRDVIISVLQDNQTNDKTLADVQRGSDRVLAITATKEEVLVKRIDLNSSQISVTRSLEKQFDVKTLSDIKAASANVAIANPKLKQTIDRHIESLQAKGDWVSFNAMALMTNSLEGNAKFTRAEVRQYIAERIQSGDYKPLDGHSKDFYANFYLKENLDTEKKLVQLAHKGIGTQEPILENAKVLLADMSLNEGQRSAAEMILSNRDRIVSLQGLAGVGKTYQLNVVADLIQKHRPDLTVKALAPTHTAKGELLKAHKITDGDTFANFLTNAQKSEERYDNTLFIIDESSMIGNRTGQNLLETIVNRGGRIVLSGDRNQLAALESGMPSKLIQDNTLAQSAEMKQIMRQSEALRPAVEAIVINRNFRQAMNILKQQPDLIDRRSDFKPESAVVAIGDINKGEFDNNELEKYQIVAEDFVSRTVQEQAQTQVITATNRHRIGINNAIQAARAEAGDIANPITIPILRRQNFSAVEMRDVAAWKENVGQILKDGNNYYRIDSVSAQGEVWISNERTQKMLNVADSSDYFAIYQEERQVLYQGDVVRINATDKDKTVDNSSQGVVLGTENGKVIVDFGDGKVSKLDPVNNITDRHLDLGYSITTMASQGGSFKNVILFVDTDMGKFIDMTNAYVDISRVKEHIQIYVSNVEQYIQQVSTNAGERLTAYEIDNAMRLAEARATWENSRNLMDTYRHKDRFSDNLITHNSRLNFKSTESELLLPTTDGNNHYTGNYVLPVNPYRGTIDFENGRLDVTDNARFIVLNQGDSDKAIEILTLSDLDKAAQMNSDDNRTVIVVLDETDKELALSEVLSLKENKLEYDIVANEDKEIDRIISQLEQEDKSYLGKDNEEAEQQKSNRLGNDETNILRHSDQERIDKGVKEKEYGG